MVTIGAARDAVTVRPEVLKADAAETVLECHIAEFLLNGDETGLGAAFNAWLKALEV